VWADLSRAPESFGQRRECTLFLPGGRQLSTTTQPLASLRALHVRAVEPRTELQLAMRYFQARRRAAGRDAAGTPPLGERE
jgi:hypothetical protein